MQFVAIDEEIGKAIILEQDEPNVTKIPVRKSTTSQSIMQMMPDHENETDEERDIVAMSAPNCLSEANSLDEELERRVAEQINKMNKSVNAINEKIEYLNELIEITLIEQHISA